MALELFSGAILIPRKTEETNKKLHPSATG